MKRPRRTSDHELDFRSEIDRLFEWSRLFVTIVGVLFGSVFAVLQFQHISIVALFTQVEPDTFVRLGLILYYNSWVLSAAVESKMAQKVYAADPNRGRVPPSMFLVLPLLVGVGLLLFWASSNMQRLSYTLAAFYIVDLIQWTVFKSLAKPMAAASAEIYKTRRQYAQLEQLNAYVVDHMQGRWQAFRYVSMAVLVLALLCASHLNDVRRFVAEHIHSMTLGLSVERIESLASPLLFLAYVVVAEGWVWLMRLRTRRRIALIDELRSRYTLRPRQPA
jgi:hypothetical protein